MSSQGQKFKEIHLKTHCWLLGVTSSWASSSALVLSCSPVPVCWRVLLSTELSCCFLSASCQSLQCGSVLPLTPISDCFPALVGGGPSLLQVVDASLDREGGEMECESFRFIFLNGRVNSLFSVPRLPGWAESALSAGFPLYRTDRHMPCPFLCSDCSESLEQIRMFLILNFQISVFLLFLTQVISNMKPIRMLLKYFSNIIIVCRKMGCWTLTWFQFKAIGCSWHLGVSQKQYFSLIRIMFFLFNALYP